MPEEDPDVLLVALLLEALQEREDADVAALASVEQLPPVGRLELVPRLLRVGAEAPGEVQQDAAARLVARLGPRVDRAGGEAARGVGDDERLVVLEDRAEAVAPAAGAARVVEGEESGCDHGSRRVTGAAGGEPSESEPVPSRREWGMEHDRDPLALLKGGRDRFGEASGGRRLRHQAVDDDEQLAGGGEVEAGRQLVEMVRSAVRQHPDEAQGAEVLDHRIVREPRHRRQREGHLQAAAGNRGKHVVGRTLRGVPAHGRAAGPAVAPADAGPEQAEVVVDFGGRADGGAAADGRVPLLDGDRRRDTLEVIHQRLGHPLEELLGVRRERLDVPPLPLGVQGVERQRALSRAGWAGNDDERPVRQLDGDALQVILPGVDDADHWGEA